MNVLEVLVWALWPEVVPQVADCGTTVEGLEFLGFDDYDLVEHSSIWACSMALASMCVNASFWVLVGRRYSSSWRVPGMMPKLKCRRAQRNPAARQAVFQRHILAYLPDATTLRLQRSRKVLVNREVHSASVTVTV